jgi:8-oxo-dGTP diphosphatase
VSSTFPGAYPNQTVRLTFEEAEFLDPGYVLVFAFHQGRLLFTRHRTRGWELPGGTREDGEWPLQTAIREVYEETGAELSAIEPIGQYVIETPGEPPLVKTIFAAKIARLHDLPSGFETSERRLCAEPPSSEEVRRREDFSLVLKDDVYRLALERVRGHRFARGSL